VNISAGLCYGHSDVPLTAGWQGWATARAEELGDRSPRLWKRVWSSPSSRCLCIAETLARSFGLRPELDKRLMELDFGDWEGKAWADLPRAAFNRWAADPSGFSPPGGESGAALLARVSAFAGMLMEDAQSCIVVSHGGPLRLLPALLRGEPADLLADAPPLGALRRLQIGAARPSSG
jgi:alpha-ribazole phosphatase